MTHLHQSGLWIPGAPAVPPIPPLPPEDRDRLTAAIAAWELALEAAEAWQRRDQDSVTDAITTMLDDLVRGADAIHGLLMIVDGLLGELSEVTGRSRDYLWALYAVVPTRMRAEYGITEQSTPGVS